MTRLVVELLFSLTRGSSSIILNIKNHFIKALKVASSYVKSFFFQNSSFV